MDVKKLGVAIDPRQAKRGAEEINRSLRQMGGTVRRVLTEADQKMMQFGRSAQKSSNTVAKASTKSANATKKAGKAAKDTGQDMAFLQAQSILAAGGMGRAAVAMGGFASAAAGAVAAMAPLLAVLLPIIAAVKVFSAVAGAAVEGTKLAGDIQRLEISFTALTGSVKEANAVLDSLRDTALRTGVTVADQATTVQKFIALGFSSGDAIQLQRNILDVAGAVGLTATEAKLLGSALAQVQSKGVVSMEELRQQIAEKGIPAIDELMKKTGLYGKEFFDAIAKGEIASKELIDIFLNLEGSFGKFAGGAERLAKSIPGQVNIIKTSWQELLRTFGEPIADAVGPILQDLINILQTAGPFAKAFGQAIGNAIRILYEAIGSGQLEKLIGLTLIAGFETAIDFLLKTWVAVVKFLGTKLGDTLGQAFANVVNFFRKALFKVAVFIAGIVNKAVDAYNAVSGSSAGGIVVGASGLPGTEAAFEPDRRTFSDFLTGQKSVIGENARDAAGDLAGKLLESSLIKNAPGSFTFSGGGDDAGGLGPVNPTGTGKKGSTKKENESIEIQLGLLAQLQQRLGDLTTEWLNVGRAITDIAEGSVNAFSENLSSALFNVASGAESAGSAFRNMANAIVQSIVQMVIQMTIQLAVAQALAALGVPVGVVGTFAQAAKAVPVNHAGGNGGNVRTSRGGFSKFHSGGVLSSENMALTDQNETVLTRKRAEELEAELRSARETRTSDRQGGQDRPLQIVNVLDQSEVLEMVAANPDVTVNAISRRRRQVDGVLKGK